MFVTRKGSNVCVAIIPKCGNTSIHEAVYSARNAITISNQQALDYEIRVAFIRDPLDRILSAFNFFRYIATQGSPFGDMPSDVAYLQGRGEQGDYESFIDYLLTNDNPHWLPMSDLIQHDREIVCNRYHLLSDINNHWFNYFDGRLPWTNAFSRVPVMPYREKDLRLKYENDYLLLSAVE